MMANVGNNEKARAGGAGARPTGPCPAALLALFRLNMDFDEGSDEGSEASQPRGYRGGRGRSGSVGNGGRTGHCNGDNEAFVSQAPKPKARFDDPEATKSREPIQVSEYDRCGRGVR